MENELIEAMEELDDSKVIACVQTLLDKHSDRFYIQKQLNEGMKRVGLLYEKGEYFIADLILSGIIYRNILDLPQMRFTQLSDGKPIGRVVIGTAEGDVHDIGKDIFASTLSSNGFEVTDLGIDVSPEVFIKGVADYSPDILAISSTLTFSVHSAQQTIEILSKTPSLHQAKIIVGGNSITKQICMDIGADAYSGDPLEGLAVCISLMKGLKTSSEQ